eukprot:4852475-Amphidinium_carterae.1
MEVCHKRPLLSMHVSNPGNNNFGLLGCELFGGYQCNTTEERNGRPSTVPTQIIITMRSTRMI